MPKRQAEQAGRPSSKQQRRTEHQHEVENLPVASIARGSQQGLGTPHKEKRLEDFKVFNDSVHGHIKMPSLLVSIIDTPEFQRLRWIKQLGMTYFVYPGASHNRFEHSIGVSYLAGELAKTLQANQKELEITDEDILCVQIAGLCHDLGHGPFSHLFDELFLPRVRPDYKKKHEGLSVEMFDYMMEKNDLRKKFQEANLDETDITFIKEQIFCEKKTPYEGRPDKSFLYEIVANKRNGIDVDKWDYFARDSLYLGISCSFDWKRCMMFARVLEKDGEKQICTRDKEVTNLYSMFHTRYTLHQRAYQHKVSKILESMIADALVNANNYLTFPGKNGKAKTMSKSINDMAAYAKLTDNVMWKILEVSDGTDPDLDNAKRLIERILVRDLYRPAGHVQLEPHMIGIKAETARKEIGSILSKNTNGELSEDAISIHIASFNYGMRGQDPMKNVLFYSKINPEEYVERSELLNENSMALPIRFEEKHLRVCSKDEKYKDRVETAFEKWCVDKKLKYKPEPLIPGMSTKKAPPPDSENTEPEKAKKTLFDEKN